jgi:CpXC protein
MSKVTADLVICSQCAAQHPLRRFESFNADRLGDQVDDIVSGRFERIACACGHVFQPEHAMLFTSYERKLWIVMQPPADRRHFAAIERDVERILAENFASAAPQVAAGLAGVRPRLVFGQRMLAEALRIALSELEPALVECAKLLWVRANITTLMSRPPFELVVQGRDADGGLRCVLHDLVEGSPLADTVIGAPTLAAAQELRPQLEDEYQALFTRPYCSAARFLYGDTV